MDFALSPEALASGYRLVAFERVGSTNAEATERARAGEAGPLWIVSGHQTLGRGRRGSAWQTEPGNLAASLLLRLDLPPATLATLGFVAGVALVEALEGVTSPSGGVPSPLAGKGGLRVSEGRMRGRGRPGEPSSVTASPCHLLPQGEKGNAAPFTLKLPNDVLLDGAKLAGILLETEETAEGRAVVIGIGVNVAHAPEGLPYPAASLRGYGFDLTAADLFGALSASWLSAFARWDGGRGFPAVREAWLARAQGLGAAITIRLPAGDVAGTFETLDGAGQLILRRQDGTPLPVAAGEVHFGKVATARQEAAA